MATVHVPRLPSSVPVVGLACVAASLGAVTRADVPTWILAGLYAGFSVSASP